VDPQGVLVGTVPLAKLVLAEGHEPLLSLIQEPLITCSPDARENQVAELFDKYNLSTLPVVDEDKKLVGVVTSDDVISLLRAKL
jgi:magnesium transporter